MLQVFLSESVKVSSKQEQLPAYPDNYFIMKCLVLHNILRTRHQAKPLCLSFDLCHEAQRLANEIAHTDRIFYQPRSSLKDFGENLYVKYQPLLLVDSQMDVTGEPPIASIPNSHGLTGFSLTALVGFAEIDWILYPEPGLEE